MAEEPNQDQARQEVENEINDLIAEAKALSDELATEIGTHGAQPTPRDPEFFESETDSEASLDLQLLQTDTAIGDTVEELGAEPAQKPKKTGITLPPKKKPGEAGPEGASETPAAPGAKKSGIKLPAKSDKPAAPKGGIKLPPSMGDDFIDDIIAGDIDEIPFDLETKKPDLVSRIKSSLPLDTLTKVFPWEKIKRFIPAEQISKARASIAETTCYVLEIVDRPFGRIGYRVRMILGLLALAMLVASVSLFFGAVL